MLKMGYGARDITPPMGVEMSGYGYYLNRCAQSVLDPLYARAIYLEDGAARGALICCDLLGLDEPTVSRTREALAEEMGLAADHVLIVSTHTHTGPTVMPLPGCGEANPEYAEGLYRELVAAAKEAACAALPVAAMRRAERRVEPIGFNRAEAGGYLDDCVRGALFEREGGAPIALVNYACHPVTLGRATAISADYPARTVRALEKEGFLPMFVNGFCGDVDPVSNRIRWGSGTEETIAAYGARLAAGFLDGLMPPGEPELGFATLAIDMRLKEWSLEEIRRAAEDYMAASEPGPARVAGQWLEAMEARLRDNPRPYVEPIRVRMLKIGRLALAAVPYETFGVVGELARRGAPDRTVLLLGCADVPLGYLPSRADIERGSYGAVASAFIYMRLPFQPGEAERLGEALQGALLRM